MATLKGTVGSATVLASAQAGNGASTNIMYRKFTGRGPVGLVITSAIGATPTVTLSIQGSADGTNWYNLAYSLVATPTTYVVTDLTITTAVTTTYLLKADEAWMYLRTLAAANTNVTLTTTAYP